MKNHHIKARQIWGGFSHHELIYCLKHLNSHEVVFEGIKAKYTFVVTYGLHCFTKDDQEHSISVTYFDGFESRQIDMERYHASKLLRSYIEKLDSQKLLYETTTEKYFTFEKTNDLTGKIERYKICICIFKENRLLRMHVTSAFFDRKNRPLNHKSVSIFKIAMDTQKKPRSREIPKEASRK